MSVMAVYRSRKVCVREVLGVAQVSGLSVYNRMQVCGRAGDVFIGVGVDGGGGLLFCVCLRW